MLIDSLYPEEARQILVNFNLLKKPQYVEDLLGRQIVIRFDMLKGSKNSDGCFKLANEQCFVGEKGLQLVKNDFVLESIVRSCVVQNIEINSYLLESKVKNFSPYLDFIDYFQFKIFIDYKYSVLGTIQFLTLMDNNLCLAYFEYATEEDAGKGHDELLAEKFKYLKITEYMVL